MQDPIAQKLTDIIQANIPDGSPKSLTLDSQLDALGMDSLGLAETIFEIEDEFDINMPEPENIEEVLTQFQTVNDLVQMVKELLSEKLEEES